MNALEQMQLQERTRLRNSSLWIPLDWGGLLAPLAAQMEVMDSLSRSLIENPMAVSDENWGIKEYQSTRTVEIEQAAVKQSRRIADDKVAAGRAKLAIQVAVDEYTLAADFYDARVRSILMAAREYAALVELQMLAVEASQTDLAIAKEGLHLAQVQADTFKAAIDGAMVQADIAKSKVEAARANVRAVQAEVSAGEAEIKAMEAEIQKYVAEAEKATLQADVAMIYADIMTKKLSAIRLDVGQAEITAGFGYLQSKLDDALALYETGALIEEIKIAGEAAIQKELKLILAAEKVSEDLHEVAVDNAQTAFRYKQIVTQANLAAEKLQQDSLSAVEIEMIHKKVGYSEDKEDAQTRAHAAVQAAYKAAYQNSYHMLNEIKKSVELID